MSQLSMAILAGGVATRLGSVARQTSAMVQREWNKRQGWLR